MKRTILLMALGLALIGCSGLIKKLMFDSQPAPLWVLVIGVVGAAVFAFGMSPKKN